MAQGDVCSDVLFEILSRVDSKTLSKCRLLSTECNSLTYESSFMRLRCQRRKTMAGYFVQSLRKNRHYSTFVSIDNPGIDSELSLDFLPDRPVSILAAVDQGLVFCESQVREHQYYICKPTTRQWEAIPSPNPRYFPRKIAMVVLKSDPLQFKIVRVSDVEYNNSTVDSESESESENYEAQLDDLSIDSDHYSFYCDYDYKRFHCEIFDSRTWTWKQIKDLVLSYDEYFNSKPAICAYRGLHWLTSNKDKNNILSFYEDQESWELAALPDCLNHHLRSIKLAKCEGKLALICVRSDFDFVELWMARDYFGEKLWIKKHTVNLKAFGKDVNVGSAESFYNADTLLMIGMYRATFCNFKNRQFDPLELGLKHMSPDAVFFLQTDYEPIQLRHYSRKSFIFSSILTTSVFLVFCFFIIFLIFYFLDV